MQQSPLGSRKKNGVIPVLDTGIQESLLVSKQTSTESGYNIFDEIIWKTGFQTGMTS
ncbi:hypothetical protein [Wolbachia endosymbiont of Oedothorax gibbosus]|uniref:hypothetical protein n=1 Tax=Wolbachia endosymbiont of Oedothorax gibbosus TaxID=931100 RepID=UPI002025A6DB|nr:hypothetical protein [Wolbachia endosymbiont of Oedothorax gibbosus]